MPQGRAPYVYVILWAWLLLLEGRSRQHKESEDNHAILIVCYRYVQACNEAERIRKENKLFQLYFLHDQQEMILS